MRHVKIIFAGILTTFFFSCKTYNNPEELKAIFYKNKSKLDLFANSLEQDRTIDSIFSDRKNMQDSLFINIKQRYPNVYSSLIGSGIIEASSHRQIYPKGKKWYFLKTNWHNEYPIYLVYDPYDSIQTKKTFYNRDEVRNETWGLGENWFMFRWVKDKIMKQ